MTRTTLQRLLPLLVVAPALAALGGWAVTTVEDLPDYATAQRPLDLAFTVRQHGQEPMPGLRPSVEARKDGEALRAVASPGAAAGRYTTRLSLPEPGEWTLTVHSGYGKSQVTLAPITVVAPGAAAPLAPTDAERGRRLFVAKGCVTCHLHRDVAGSGQVAVGPELTAARFAPEYLKQFLADPSIKPLSPGRSEGMPNLRLKPGEIAALAAFVNGERQASR